MLIRKDADNTVRWKEGERLNHYFEATCDRLPADHVAVIAEDATYTFRELDNRANQAARYLMDQGIKPGDRVGLLFDKSSNQHIALLGVLKAGAAYVPLDASFPSERVSFILEDAQVDTIVSVSRFEDKLAEFNATPIFLDRATQEIDAKSTDRVTEEEAPLADEQLFYIIYTSGTTGKPKGVAIDHSGICNFCVVAGETYRITEEDRCYQGITLAFDFHVEDLWMPLIAGATLISGKSDANLFGEDLHDYLQHHRITVFPCVPTLWATVEADLDDIRVIILSGEEVPHHLVVKWHREGRYILNAYGPTECSVSSTIRFLTPDIPVTIGTPLPTYTVVILDVDKPELIEEGGTGEIGIAGIALARGYLNREELTAKTFIPDFIGLDNNPSGRIYRTGDLGRINEDGEIEFLGRIDTQVKIRGYRVELGEIEAVLMKVPQIAQAVVNPWSPEQGATDLVAYYTKKPDAGDIDPAEIADTLRSHLPGYMVPSYMEELDQIPMTPNNKADRKNLPEPQGSRFVVAGGEIVAPRTDTEQQVADALTAIMGLEEVSVVDNFFQDMGAHSLLMAQFGAELRNRMNVGAVSIRDIYLNPTIEQLAAYLESLSHQTPGSVESDLAPEPFHIPSAFAYWTCGALQALWFLGWSVAGFWIFVESIKWTYAAMPDLGATYVRILVVALAVAIFFSLLPIVAKWLFIGKWKREAIPIWSLRYFRFWAIKNLVNSAPMARFGDPFYNLYLRLLGAKVGKNAVLHITNVPVCTDLISFGDNAVVAKDVLLSGYKAQNNYIRIGPVHVGANAVVSEAAVLDINTVMEDNTQLGIASSLQAGQTVAEGRHYHGTPGQETSADYCVIEPMPCSTLRRWAYPGIILTAGFTTAPLAVLLLYYFWPWIYEFLGGVTFAFEATKDDYATLAWNTGWISFAVFFAFLVLGLLYIGTVPRLLNMFLEKDRTYVLYGFHYFIHELIAATSNSEFYNRLFGDSSAIVYYAKWVGYEMNKIIQSGSNFGMSQKHDNPFLCDIGSGTMVSGGLKMVNETSPARGSTRAARSGTRAPGPR